MSNEFPTADLAAWRAQVERELGGEAFESLSTVLPGELRLEPLYVSAPEPLSAIPRARGWRVCPRIDHPIPAAAGALLAADREGGATAAWIELGRAGRLGLEQTAEARELVGLSGVAIYDVPSLAEVTGPLDGLVAALDGGGNALPFAAIALALAEQQGVREPALWFAGDPLGALARDGALPADLDHAETELALLAKYCRDRSPSYRSVLVSTRPYHDAGADPVQELSYALATGVHYLRLLTTGGTSPAAAAAQIAFSLPVGRDLFSELCKLRALKLGWSKILTACGVSGQPVAIHASASHRTLTRRDPWVNVLRVTTEVFAAICGGAELITPLAFDQAFGQPEELGRRIARNTPIILQEESKLGDAPDPARGSYYLESLTDQLARAAWSGLQRIEAAGGMRLALEHGVIRTEVDQSWRSAVERIEKGEAPITGVTRFAPKSEVPLVRTDGLDDGALEAHLSAAHERRSARGVIRINPSHFEGLIAGARDGATLAELSRSLARGAEPATMEPFPVRRDSEAFETEEPQR